MTSDTTKVCVLLAQVLQNQVRLASMLSLAGYKISKSLGEDLSTFRNNISSESQLAINKAREQI